MTGVFSNPELIRNIRAQLRPGRLLAAAGICTVLSLVVGFSMAYAYGGVRPRHVWGMEFLQTVLFGQAFALVIGGGIACLLAIHREKEMNTFDFQRVTRLKPFELALGKLFGAPAMAYFVVLCLMPAAIVGAVLGRARLTFFLAAYIVLVLGSVTLHALALVISLVLPRGTTAAAVLLFLALVGLISADNRRNVFEMRQTSPFVAVELVEEKSWELGAKTAKDSSIVYATKSMTDIFFGLPVHHVYFLTVLYMTFTIWFLLALTRNIKRDAAAYEVYTPSQSIGLLLYVNLLMLGFFKGYVWTPQNLGRPMKPLEAQTTLLSFNILTFFVLGLLLLRTRDQLRRLVRQAGERRARWLRASWPGPCLLAGAVLVGCAVTAKVHWTRDPKDEWNLGLALFRLAFFGMWLTRDFLYLQWMNLRRVRRPLLVGILYLIVFYTSTIVLFNMLDFYKVPERIVFTSAFLPSPVFLLDTNLWMTREGMWVLALVLQGITAGLFAYLQWRKVAELSASSIGGSIPTATVS